MSWYFTPAIRTFEAARKHWDELNAACGNHMLSDSAFVMLLLRHFADGHVTLAVNTDVGQRGAGLLVRGRPGLWESFQPSQAPIGLFLLEYPDATGEELRKVLRKLPGHALQLSILQQDPDHTSLPLKNVQADFERLDYIRTARVTLTGTFEEYWKRRGTNLRHNLARQRRRLAEKGQRIELVVRCKPEEVAAAIREYGSLESRGWKAKEGTAVAEHNVQGRFYRDLFENFCARGEGLIYQLLFNGKVAAMDLCLKRDGMMVVLKTTYNEELNEFSPSFLMREEILRRLFVERQVRILEFYGRVMEWHTRWTDEIRTMYHVICFRKPWVRSLKAIIKTFRSQSGPTK
jgi:hypothetical protein